MRAADIHAIYHRYRAETGIVGVALGPKESAGRTADTLSVAFFVSDKLPVKGAKRRLADGRRRLPKIVETNGVRLPTDVVTVSAATALAAAPAAMPPLSAGGRISNLQLTGTMGCLVASNAKPGLFAITNQHIALGSGTMIAFPDFGTIGAVLGTTDTSVGLIADEQFLPPFDRPQTYIDVDCALVRIPANLESRFTPEVPGFGKPVAAYPSQTQSEAAFANSLLNLNVYAFGWPSGPRRGTISHVFYAYQREQFGMTKVVSFLVRSNDAGPPGILGDSGKLWMTNIGGRNLGVGIHSGVVADNANASRFAMATELSALLRFLNVRLL